MASFGDDDCVLVLQSRALSHLFTKIRDRETAPSDFAHYASRIMRLLAEEGIACLPARRKDIVCMGTGAHFSGEEIDMTKVTLAQVGSHWSELACTVAFFTFYHLFFFLFFFYYYYYYYYYCVHAIRNSQKKKNLGKVCAVSIVRAGDSLLDAVRACAPGIPVGKILIQVKQ